MKIYLLFEGWKKGLDEKFVTKGMNRIKNNQIVGTVQFCLKN